MHVRLLTAAGCFTVLAAGALPAMAQESLIPVAHLYHCHMPNYWPFYAIPSAMASTYNNTAVGSPVRYDYDGSVILLQESPPAGYPYILPSAVGSGIMPHDAIASYYQANAKYECYQGAPSGQGWPSEEAELMQSTTATSGSGYNGQYGQVYVNFSGSLVNDVNSIETLNAIPGTYGDGSSWSTQFATDYSTLKTADGFRTLDFVHFDGHHALGPLVGSEFFLKDLIFHNATVASSYFMGSNFTSSHGFFPTELCFSERLIPTLAKLGVTWSLMGNNHFSRCLQDYPFATYDATGDCLDSPPNRGDQQDTSSVGSWISESLQNQAQNLTHKFPFDSTPHWVRYVDPTSGAVSELAGIPVSANGEWQEGYEGSITVAEYTPYIGMTSQPQFYVIAHDGDNSSGRDGSYDTWQAGITVTGTGQGFSFGVDEYLKHYPIPSTDVQHIQDGSWPDVLDACCDPMFYHWHVPFGIWSTQFSAFNSATGNSLSVPTNLKGTPVGMQVSLQHGWNFQERDFELLMAPLNYAETAEQIWLENNPSYWSPQTTMDNQITYPGNQLNPYMLAAPVKGNTSSNYAGGANPAELAWYFLLPAMDSGFGYYGENEDDDVKPTLAFNNSLFFSEPYVQANLSEDKTGPSVFIPQRYPYNPGEVNASKAEGYTTEWFNNHWCVYTFAYDVSGIASMNLMVRTHSSNTINVSDDTFKVYNPSALQGTAGLNITPSNVGSWVSYPMNFMSMQSEMNGVSWVPDDQETFAVLPAQLTGDLYYYYLSNYSNQMVDYYIQATDTKGNVTNTPIQTTFVGPGTYNTGGNSGYTTAVGGSVQGTDPFLSMDEVNGSGGQTVTATPSISPASGTYSSAQTVTISDGTSGATIYYTTNGTTPTTSSTKYSGAIAVSSTETIEAMATASGDTNSQVASATYTIGTAQTAATPTFSPAAGSYTSSQSVTISDSTSGSTIYYTTNGTTPTTSSTVYSGAITVSSTETIEAIAAASGYSNSAVASAAYTISTSSGIPVTFTIANANTTFGYNLYVAGNQTALGNWAPASAFALTIQGSGANVPWSGTVTLPASTAIQYKYIQYNGSSTIWEDNQSTTSGNRQITTPASGTLNENDGNWNSAQSTTAAATPALTPAAGTYTTSQAVTMSSSTSGSTIYYTTNGTTPTTSSTKYAGAVTVSATQTIEAIAVASNHQNSSINTSPYTIQTTVATPTFSPAAGTYSSSQSVTISDSTSGATIYYTTNGTTPTTFSTKYSSAITVSASETLKAIAVKSGMTNSAVGSAAYTIQAATVATPTFSPAAGTYSSAQTVTISDSTSGATIYYTTNGSTPTTSSTKYSAAIKVSASETLKALAVKSGDTNSAVGSAAYTIK